MSLRETLLTKRRTAAVRLDGETAYVRVVSGAEFNEIGRRLDAVKDDATRNAEAMVIVVNATACDERGNRLFTDAEVELTRQISLDSLAALFEAAIELNGMGEKKVSPPSSGSSSA